MSNNKSMIYFAILLLFSFSLISAHGEETFSQAEEIIENKISCDDLTMEELEILGDYYMEQMHPGEQHEVMDEMMGGEGSESLRQAHINMGLSFYCGEHDAMSGEIMDMMMGRTGMMGSGNMMGNFGDYRTYGIFGLIFMILIIVTLVLLIIWLINALQNKKHKKRKRRWIKWKKRSAGI